MKKILLVLAVIIGAFMMGCSSAPSDEVDQTYKATDTAWTVVYDSVPVYVNGVPHNEWKPVKKVHAQIDRVTFNPTWGQSFHYAFKYGYTASFWIGLIILLAGVAGITADQLDKFEPFVGKLLKNPNLQISPYVKNILFIALIVAGALFLDWQPGNVKFNNKKDLPKAAFDKYVQDSGSTQPIWDSLEVHNLIIGASHK